MKVDVFQWSLDVRLPKGWEFSTREEYGGALVLAQFRGPTGEFGIDFHITPRGPNRLQVCHRTMGIRIVADGEELPFSVSANVGGDAVVTLVETQQGSEIHIYNDS